MYYFLMTDIPHKTPFAILHFVTTDIPCLARRQEEELEVKAGASG
jgi:hypothetical protein